MNHVMFSPGCRHLPFFTNSHLKTNQNQSHHTGCDSPFPEDEPRGPSFYEPGAHSHTLSPLQTGSSAFLWKRPFLLRWPWWTLP